MTARVARPPKPPTGRLRTDHERDWWRAIFALPWVLPLDAFFVETLVEQASEVRRLSEAKSAGEFVSERRYTLALTRFREHLEQCLIGRPLALEIGLVTFEIAGEIADLKKKARTA